jgi:5-methylcytosine-specific restriction endonuclease McrA
MGTGMATPKKIERDLRVFQRDKFCCVYCGYCGDTFKTWRYLTVDHFKPRAFGGAEDDENLVTACVDCNCIKSGYQFASIAEAKAQMAVWLAKERKDFDEHFASFARSPR